jgi:hypothetical protein
MATVVTIDKPGFQGQVMKMDGQIVCILAPAAAHDRVIQARVRRLMLGQGIDCLSCAECPVGQAQ